MRTTERCSLRDRKRAETTARIEAAAVELVLRDGPDAATVDAISDRAGISPRTFFNYFDSKDSAILGIQPDGGDELVLEERLAAGHEGEDPVVVLVGVVAGVLRTGSGAGSRLRRDREAIIRRHPEILGSQLASLSARKTRLLEYAARILSGDVRFPDDADADARAGIVLAMCVAAVKAAFDEWARSAAPVDPQIEERAVALIHTTLRSLV